MSEEEKSELSTICRQLKWKAPDGKMRETDAAERQKLHWRVRMINLLLIIDADGEPAYEHLTRMSNYKPDMDVRGSKQ